MAGYLRKLISLEQALKEVVRQCGLTGAFFLGDDNIDVDAFKTIHDLADTNELVKGFAVAITDEETPGTVIQNADYALGGVSEVANFLDRMIDITNSRRFTDLPGMDMHN